MARGKEDDNQRRKALESGRGTKTNHKRVAENITEDYLLKRLKKQRELMRLGDKKGSALNKAGRQIDNTLSWYERIYKQNREDF